MMERAIEATREGKRVKNMAPSVQVLLENPPFIMDAIVAEGLIKGAY